MTSVNSTLALHCLNADGHIRCPLLREVAMSKKLQKYGDSDQSCAGRSIIEMLEGKLDAVFDLLLSDAPMKKSERNKVIGRGEGLTHAIALMYNPYYINEEAVKDSAMERWEERQAE